MGLGVCQICAVRSLSVSPASSCSEADRQMARHLKGDTRSSCVELFDVSVFSFDALGLGNFRRRITVARRAAIAGIRMLVVRLWQHGQGQEKRLH